MARGNEAKEKLLNKIIENLGEFYLGTYDKKHYFTMSENGEQVQIAISMTCPKTPVEFANKNTDVDSNGNWDFSDSKPKATPVAVNNAAPAEITEQETKNIEELMAKLGL